ncbi:MAG: zinc ribbon domain-containing protein [Dehalococcoidales bacterium]|jgi:ssDNA-binding Zn-finger/Zn-ribbon topoisomerase 1|nr:zinc ribbon domain-containing protein [Dehalococcoidales bacterium]
MPFGNKARNVMTYEFGCLEPTEGKRKAIEVMRMRTQLWNKLVELHQGHLAEQEKMLEANISLPKECQCPECAAIFRVTELDKSEIVKRNKCPSCKAYIKEYRAQRKAAFQIESVKEALALLEKQEYEEHKAIYKESGLYWGNYLDVTNAWQVAKKRPGKLRFHSSRDGGKVHVQWPKGMKVADAFDHTSNVLRLNPIAPEAYHDPQRCVRRKAQHSVVSIRIASTEDKKPVWLTLPCVLHRPLPENGLIRSADVLRERVATHWRWKLIIVVETQPDAVTVTKSEKSGAIAIDIGWRKRPDGLRVCYWSDTFGRQGELLLSNYFLTGLGKVDSIKSKRDLDFNEARDLLVAWKKKAGSLPEWFSDRTKTLSQWKATAKLASLAIFWRNNRFEGDDDIFQVIEKWRWHDKHHYEYQVNLNDRLIRQRREQYRIFAAQIAEKYDTVVLENFDLREVTRRSKNGGIADDVPDAVNKQRQRAGVSILRLAILNSCKRNGLVVEKIEAAHTTDKCYICGHIFKADEPEKLIYTCPKCNKSYDQDYNACRNLLKEYANRKLADG